MRARLLLLVILSVGLAACGSAESGSSEDASSSAAKLSASDGDRGEFADDADGGGVEIPDASFGDAADAWSATEDAGLTPVFADANQDVFFDSTRDGTGGDVIDQSPAAGEMAAEGDEVEITIDCSQVDWENGEGPAWEDFNDAYSSSFDEGCQELFDESPDGSLYEDDTEYSVYDCQNLNPGDGSEASDVPTDVPDDPESAGAELGELDGCQALFEQEGVYSLNWGEDSITEADCPVGSAYVAAPRPGRKRASKPCAGEQADGTPIAVRTEQGKVNCAGAVALWQEFLKRAPTEGMGSSGYTKFEGWACAGAPAADTSHYGNCERLDKTASFTVLPG
jgi:hypothetical protein